MLISKLLFLLAIGFFASAQTNSTIVDEILEALKNAVDCASCMALLDVLKGVAELGDTIFSDSFVAVCEATELEDDDVCQGLFTQQGPILAHDLRSISPFGQTAEKLCAALIGLCPIPPVNNFTVSFPKPAPSTPQNFTSKGRPPFQVGHLSDVHIDRMYTKGSEVNCTKPICCRDFADETGPIEVPAGPFGSHNCDTPVSLVNSTLNAMNIENPRFSLFTGDVIEAAVWLVNRSEATTDLQAFDNEMQTLLKARMFPVIGNHDVAPVNLFPRSTTIGASAQWVFDLQSHGWLNLIGGSAAEQVRHTSGSYSIIAPGTDLHIISLNTIYWYQENFYLYDSDIFQPDPNGILEFAIQQLQAAEDAGQRAWIIAHMPPSGSDALHDQSNYFNQVVQRYKNTIAGQFYGHFHTDEFAIAYSDFNNQTAETADSMGWMAPSLTPRNGNAAFRIYDVDPDTYEIMDSRTFFSNLSAPSFEINPVWELEYSARDLYGPAIGGWPATESLSSAFWHMVTEAFAVNDTLFQEFNALKTRLTEVIPCDTACQTTTICNLRALRAENNCDAVTPGVQVRRSDDIDAGRSQAVHTNLCEGPTVRSFLSRVSAQLNALVECTRDVLDAEPTGSEWVVSSIELSLL